jgi:hypothetical protein
MNANHLRIGFTVVALLAISGGLSGLGYHGWYSTGGALAASAQEKTQARNSLNQVTAALRSVDTAYASGNAAEAQTKFEEARSNWDGARPKDVKSTVSGMLEELREDIARELR